MKKIRLIPLLLALQLLMGCTALPLSDLFGGQKPTTEALSTTAAPQQTDAPSVPEDPYEAEVLESFQHAYRVYRRWIQGRSGTQCETVNETDSETGITVNNGKGFRNLLLTVFSERYTDACMERLGVTASDPALYLPVRNSAESAFDLMSLDPSFGVTNYGSSDCKVKIMWNDSVAGVQSVYFDGTKQNGSWVFDDLTTELAEGATGLFGSSAIQKPAETESENMQILYNMYIVNVKSSAYLRSTPEEIDGNIITTVPLGETVGFVEQANSVYSRVCVNGTYGYIKSKYLGPNPPSTSSNTTITAYLYISGVNSSAYLRSTPEEISTNIITTIPLGEAVGYIEEANSVYSRVYWNGHYGYVKTKYLSATSPYYGYNTMYIANVPNSVYLRSSPKEDPNNIITTIPLGTAVEYIGYANSTFTEIYWNGYYGYVKTKYLSYYKP